MADIVGIYYQKLLELMLTGSGKISVPKDFHSQIKLIDNLLKNDKSAIVSTIYEFMVNTATVDINFTSKNETMNNLLKDLKENINSNINIDIPRGLRTFTEQYFRERWKSSFIVLKIRWKKVDGYFIPSRMWIMDGASIYAKNDKKLLNTMEYYFGKPTEKKKNQLIETDKETILIRKPYNQWYDAYPTPYFVKKGTLYHALFKEKVLSKQAEVLDTAFPYQLLIKAGSDEAMRTKQMPSEEDLKKLQEQYKKRKEEFDEHVYSKGLVGAFPYDINFEELIPDYKKVVDDALLKPADKNLLSSLGLIELKGFSSNREEAILNPKVLIEEIQDAVFDYIELLDDVVYIMKQKNNLNRRNLSKIDISIEAGIIKAFITDEMRSMIRSLYDRGLISAPSTIENATPLNFERQLKLRDKGRKEKWTYRLYPPVTQNLEKDVNDPSIPDDKIPGSPESKNYKNAHQGFIVCENCKSSVDYLNIPESGMGYIQCPECSVNIDQTGKCYNACAENNLIVKKLETIFDIPVGIKKYLSDIQANLFINKFNEKFDVCTELKMDNYLREKQSMQYAIDSIKIYLEAPYQTNSDLPDSVKNNLPKHAQDIFRNAFNSAVKQGHNEETAFKIAWSAVKNVYKKNNKGKWVKK